MAEEEEEEEAKYQQTFTLLCTNHKSSDLGSVLSYMCLVHGFVGQRTCYFKILATGRMITNTAVLLNE